MTSKQKCKGFTLVELIIVIIILLILVSTAATVLVQQFQLFNTGQELLDADWQGRVALNRMVRDMRDTSDVTIAETDKISFYDDDLKDIVTYQLVGNQLVYSTTNTNISSPLADNIQNFELEYHDENDNQPNNTTDIRYVTITLNIVNESANINEISNFHLTTAVFLWNTKNF